MHTYLFVYGPKKVHFILLISCSSSNVLFVQMFKDLDVVYKALL